MPIGISLTDNAEQGCGPFAEGPGSSLARLLPVAFEGMNTGSMPPACSEEGSYLRLIDFCITQL